MEHAEDRILALVNGEHWLSWRYPLTLIQPRYHFSQTWVLNWISSTPWPWHHLHHGLEHWKWHRRFTRSVLQSRPEGSEGLKLSRLPHSRFASEELRSMLAAMLKRRLEAICFECRQVNSTMYLAPLVARKRRPRVSACSCLVHILLVIIADLRASS